MKTRLPAGILCLILFAFYSSSLLAQQPAFIQGKELTFPEKPVSDIIGSDETGFYALRFSTIGRGVHTFIEKYDNSTLELLWKKEMDSDKTILEIGAVGYPETVNAFLVKGKVFVFFECVHPKTKIQKLFLQVINADNSLSQVMEIDSKDLGPVMLMGLGMWKEFNVTFSPDKESFMIGTGVVTDNKPSVEAVAKKTAQPVNDEPDTKRLKLYSSSTYEKIWEKDISYTEKGKPLSLSAFTVDNANNLYYRIAYRSSEGEQWLSGIALGISEKNSPTSKTIPVNIPDKKVLYSFNFHFLKSGDMVLCGVIGDTVMTNRVRSYSNEAFFIKRIEAGSRATQFEGITPIKIYQPELKPPSFGLGFGEPKVIEMNNELYVITEVLYYEGLYYTGMNIHYKDIVVSKFSDAGALQWMRPIRRYIYRSSYNGSNGAKVGNYNVLSSNNKLYFLFLEDPANKDYDGNDPARKFQPVKLNKPANAVSVSIDPEGTINKSYFYENTDKGLNYIPAPLTELQPGKMLIYMNSKKLRTEKFSVLNFNK